MIFHNHQRDIINHTPKLELNGEPLVRVEDFNFLGLTIDQHMTWNAHIQKLSNKISRSLGVMNRLKRHLPQNILRIIHNSLILPHINYSILVWGFKSSRISKLQKRAVRMISCSITKKHYRFISMKCSPKLLINTIMELDNNRLKFFINIQLEPILDGNA